MLSSVIVPLVWTLLLHGTARAADCTQQRRDGDPSGPDISTELKGSGNIHSICNSGFPPGSDLVGTFNLGTIVFKITRSDASQPLQHCEDAFNQILDQCVDGSDFWGGAWSLDGESYDISDIVYPDHTLPSDLTKTSASSSSSQSGGVGTSLPASAIVVTTQVSGKAVTETFVPVTISGKSSTTSSTKIGGIVYPLIIGAGGVAFAPSVFSAALLIALTTMGGMTCAQQGVNHADQLEIIPFIPGGGVDPPPITPPSHPDYPITTPTADPTTSQASSSSSSSSSSTRNPPETYAEKYFVGAIGSLDSHAATSTTTYKRSGATTSSSTPSSATSATSTSTRASCTPIAFADGTFAQALQSDCSQLSVASDSNIITMPAPNSVNFPDTSQKYCSLYTSGDCEVSVGWNLPDFATTPDPKPSNKDVADAFNQAMSQANGGCVINRTGNSGIVATPDSEVLNTPFVVCVMGTGRIAFPHRSQRRIRSAAPEPQLYGEPHDDRSTRNSSRIE
ncbi:hypothetical protein LTR95_016439 [Oleoguttula sp. CCFEE 5521]